LPSNIAPGGREIVKRKASQSPNQDVAKNNFIGVGVANFNVSIVLEEQIMIKTSSTDFLTSTWVEIIPVFGISRVS